MKTRTLIAIIACALAGCDDPQGQTQRFLREAAKAEDAARGKVDPLPEPQKREIAPLVIERDPFKR